MAIRKKKSVKDIIRAVIYIRYSSHRQDGSFSIEYQMAECERYINNKGYKLMKMYIDKAKTGKKVAGREEFEQMCRDAAHDKYDVIIVFSLSRSFRNVREALNFCHEMQEKHSISIESVIEPVDMTSPHGKFSSTNLFAMHELQSDITANHVKAGMHIAAQQGYFLGGYVPYGYTTYGTGEFARGKEKRKYTPHDTEKETVKMIFELYADGFSLNYIQSVMKENKITGRKDKIMGIQTISRILRNEFYIGTRTFDIDGYDKLVMPDSVPAIIDNELWARVQKRHAENKEVTPRKRNKRLYELTGKIHCKKCNAHYSGEHKNDNRNPDWSASWYVCSTKKGQRTCDAKNIRKDRIDKFVIDSIKKYILTADYMNEIAEQIATIAGNSPTDLQQKIKDLEKQKSELVRMESDLTLKDLKGEISRETYLNLKSDFTTQIADINLELLQLNAASETAITKEAVLNYLNDILLNIETSDPDILKNIFDKVVDRIEVTDEEITLFLVVSPLSSPYSESKTTSGQPHYKLSSSINRRDLNSIN